MAKKKQKPVKLITLDTETYNGLIGELKRIAIYDGKEVYYGYKFEDIEPILNNYFELGYSVEVYIHNMEFDLKKLPCIFDKARIEWEKSLLINGKVALISCKKYRLHDSFKLLPMSLKKLSQGFNVKHGKLDLWKAVQERYPNQYNDIVDFLDRCNVDDELFLEYLGYDVISLFEVLQVLIEISGIKLHDFVNRVSTSSLSRFIFKNGHNGKVYKNPFNAKTDYEMLCSYNWYYDLDTEEFLRMSYCGGRTEVFTPILNGKGFHYDVNSLYPSVMKGKEYPVGKPQYTENPILSKRYYEKWKENRLGLGFVNARVYIPFQPVPPLPVKMGKLTFPCGEVYGTWTYEELEFAESECGVKILEYYGACHFNTVYPVFDNFISDFYEMKERATKEKNEPLRTFSKLIQNVGYGYCGMRRDDKTSLAPYEELETLENVIYADSEMGFCEYETEIKAEYIQVQVASYVTSRARLVLLKALRHVLNNGGQVFYCDTDSIVSNIPLPSEIVDDSKLGYWALEGEPIKGVFLRPKVYTEVYEKEPETIKFKGVSKETQESLDFSFYEELLNDLIEEEKDFKIVEKNKLQMRSVMFMQKNHLEPTYHEYRDKKMNYKTVEKRVMNYKENYTKPHFFETLEEFENFTFKPMKKEVQFDMKRGIVCEDTEMTD